MSLTGTIIVVKEPLLSTFNILSLFIPILISITTLVTTLWTLTTPITTIKKWGRLKKNLVIINIPAIPTTSTALIF